MTTTHDRILLAAWFALPFTLAAIFTGCAIADLHQDDQPQHSVISTQPAPVPVPVERGGNW